jgi:hypothetical protein
MAIITVSEHKEALVAERPVVLPPFTNRAGSIDMHGLALLGIYFAVALAGQAIGLGISSQVERFVPWAGLPVFMAIFFGVLVLAWPIAVVLLERFVPEPLEAPVSSRVV